LRSLPTYQGASANLIKEILEGNTRLFLSDVLSSLYDLGYEHLSDKELTGRSSWFTKKYYDWMTSNGMECKVLVIDSEGNGTYIVPYVMGFTIDFTFKHLLEKDQEEYTIANMGDYIALGYEADEMCLFDEFPKWITYYNPPKSL